MKLMPLILAGAAAAAVAMPTLVLSQPPAAPPSAGPSRDPATAPAGTYNLDGRHLNIAAKVQHNGVSWSIFRMDKATGTLVWNPAAPETSKIDVTVDPASITSNLAGFGEELAGPRFLDAATHPQIKFVSTRIERTGPTTGIIHADMTFRGVTKPVQAQAEFLGSTTTFRGDETIGFNAKFNFKRADFGMTGSAPLIGETIEVEINAEWIMTPAA